MTRGAYSAPVDARAKRAIALALVSAIALTFSLLGASKSSAAPGDPFDPLTPYVFVGQDAPTSLYRAVAGAGGAVAFAPEGGAEDFTYNAISYNENDDYLYGVVVNGGVTMPTGAVIRIGQGGVVTRVGTDTVPVAYSGAFGSGNSLYLANSASTSFSVVDTTTGTVTSTGTLAAAPQVWDMTYAFGYFWSVNNDGDLTRIDLESPAATKPVDVFPLGLAAGQHGAAWTFGNGNIGVSNNSTGLVTQIAVENPGSANPTISVVSTSPGPASSNNDGAASAGAPTDLSIVKDAPVSYNAGDSITYTVTVTNDGPGLSTGSVVTDLVPTGLTNVRTSTPGCTVVSNQVSCTVGELAADESATITITVDSPSSTAVCFTNDASVLANEVDPDPSNNEASVTSCPRALSIANTSDATAATRIGDIVTYTVTATNTGPGAYTLAEPAAIVDDLSELLDDATYNDDATTSTPGLLGYTEPRISWSGPLAGGASVDLTYSVTTRAGGDGTMRNVAFQPTDPGNPVTPACAPPVGGLDPTSGEPCAQTTSGLPSLEILKTADRANVATVGETITYSYLITNTGGTTFAPVSVTETAFSGTGGTPTPVCPAAANSLAPGASVTCTATYVTTQADVNSGAITNTAVGTGTIPGGPPFETPPSSVRVETPGPSPAPPVLPVPPVPAAPQYDLQMTKTATRKQVTVGDTITYRLLAKNVGPDAADGVRVTDDAPSHLDVRSAETPQGTCAVRGNSVDCAVGKLDSGQSVTVTVRATALRSGTSTNTAVVVPPVLPPGVPPVDPPANNTSTARVRIVKPQLRVRKTVDRSTLRAGQTATYTVRVTNPSRRAVRNVRTCDRLPSGLSLVSSRPTANASRGQHCWTVRSLGAGKSVTYRVTVRVLSGTQGRKTNVARATSPDARSGRATRSVRVTATAVRGGGVTG